MHFFNLFSTVTYLQHYEGSSEASRDVPATSKLHKHKGKACTAGISFLVVLGESGRLYSHTLSFSHYFMTCVCVYSYMCILYIYTVGVYIYTFICVCVHFIYRKTPFNRTPILRISGLTGWVWIKG